MNFDIVDQIDALVDEQMAGGEPCIGYDYNDPNYPKCWHCGRHWHGLPITQRVTAMYGWGTYDETYEAADDDSPIVCHGSDFIGPMPAPSSPKWTATIGDSPRWIDNLIASTEAYLFDTISTVSGFGISAADFWERIDLGPIRWYQTAPEPTCDDPVPHVHYGRPGICRGQEIHRDANLSIVARTWLPHRENRRLPLRLCDV